MLKWLLGTKKQPEPENIEDVIEPPQEFIQAVLEGNLHSKGSFAFRQYINYYREKEGLPTISSLENKQEGGNPHLLMIWLYDMIKKYEPKPVD